MANEYLEKQFAKEFKVWVPRMHSRPEALEQEFVLDVPFEEHAVYMFRLENRKYAVVDVCCDDGDEYDPQWDTIVIYPDYRDAYIAFRRYVQKELAENTPVYASEILRKVDKEKMLG